MPQRPFTDDDIVQADDGSAVPVADVDVTLPAGTTEGMSGIIYMKTATGLDPPEGWEKATENAIVAFSLFHRIGLPAGETSWFFDALGAGVPPWVWRVEEWRNLGRQVTALSAWTGAPGATASTGTSAGWTAPYVLGVAAFAVQKNATNGVLFPTFSDPTNGFAAAGIYDIGTGATALDMRMMIAHRFGTLDEAGGWESSVSFTGTMTNFNSVAAMAVYRAEEAGEAWNAGQALQVG